MKFNYHFRINKDSIKLTLRAFQYRNYRLFFFGQGISLIGTWMQRIALSWLVYRLTDSAFLLGFVGFASQMPTFLLSPFAGVVADKSNKLRIMIITQALSMLQAFILAILVLTDKISIWQIIALGTFLGLVTAFDVPTRQSFVVQMVDRKEDLGNAIALNSFVFNSARLIGPSLAGVLVAAIGEGICFLLNAISYIAVIIALLVMKIKPKDKLEVNKSNVLQGLKEGFNYTFSYLEIRYTLLLLSSVSLFGMPYAVLMPIFAKDILHGDSHTLGFLMAGAGVGAILGALYMASRRDSNGLERIIPIATGTFGFGLIVFSLSHSFWLSLILISFSGAGMMVQMASCNTFIQTIVDDNKRGRVMSFYAMSFMGLAPFGSLLAGSMAKIIGAPNTLIMGGIVCLLIALIYISRFSFLGFRRSLKSRVGS